MQLLFNNMAVILWQSVWLVEKIFVLIALGLSEIFLLFIWDFTCLTNKIFPSCLDWSLKYCFGSCLPLTYLTNRIFLSCLGWSRRDSSASCLAFSSNLLISSVCPVSEKKCNELVNEYIESITFDCCLTSHQ
jgi:hypothetical protein